MTVTAVSAAVSSFSGLRSLAAATGWPGALAPLLPLTIDAYAMTGTRVWLSGRTRSAEARGFARWNAILAITLSLVGNAAWHLVAAGTVQLGWPIVVCVGAVPPAVLGLLSHLAVLRGQNAEDAALTDRPDEDQRQDDGTMVDEDARLLEAARAADAAHRAEHGKAITRDELRKVLHVSTERTSHILRLLRQNSPSTSDDK
ncbi:DUF2637 domain-containing protein [Amycolatopsis sp. NPDC049688]|uniref:DUF2637 domain-containing protein n=1 Tax=Amycolatopsis sp. NPDC049688 TaxID=3154733 RepID=UPI003419D49E